MRAFRFLKAKHVGLELVQNPLNQANMYNNSAALYYNNPLNQANMYNNSAALYYNNPLNQANMYNN